MKNKKVVIYGAGDFAKVLFENYDLSKFNILAVSDKKFEKDKSHFFGYKTISPEELKTFDCDVDGIGRNYAQRCT